MGAVKLISLLLAVLILGAPQQGAASPTSVDTAAVHLAIRTLFDGMRASDSAAVSSVLHPEMTLNTVVQSEDGSVRLQSGSREGFLKAVGTPKGDVWDERIQSIDIRVDGALASAWMDYSFFVGERFSHCGVNAMHLVRQEHGWFITAIIDTRRSTGCGA
jgi:hypothetical protein